jgi:hypothetical protein
MKLLTIIFSLFFLGSCKKDPQIIVTDLNPIAHYTFTGNSNDLSKYSNNGKITNLTLATDSFGAANCAYFFNGNGYLEIPDKDILDFKTNKLTVSAWIKPLYVSGSYIVEKATFVNSQGQLTEGGGPFSLDIYPGTPRALIYSADELSIILTGKSQIKYNVWQHLLLTWDGKIAYLYYNGKLEASGVFEKEILVTNGNLYIGAYKWAFPAGAFNGSIDNVRIYNRYLTESEIQDIYINYK